jgi:sulfite exporter TauE/SafE
MFDFNQSLLVAGLLLGFSSSLHCFGMCSGIAASLHFAAAKPGGSQNHLSTAALINSGRVMGYVIAGALVGELGSQVFGFLDRSVMNAVLRWAGALSLGWIGLSMLGFLPLPAFFYRIGMVVSDGIAAVSATLRLPPWAALFISGTVWGFLPCAMVYATLFYAMLSGSWLGGAIVMLGFGIGTLPALVAAGMGLATLRHRATSARLQGIVGVVILLLGIANVTLSGASFPEWCRFG